MKPKPRKRRTRDVKMWTIFWTDGYMSRRMLNENEKSEIVKSGNVNIAKWLPVVVKGVPVPK